MVALARRASLCAACLLVALGASAQTPGGSLPTVGTSLPAAIRGPQPDAVALEGAVDARRYIVGPGDVFSIVIGGIVPREFTATVSADGRLVVAEAGAFQADGRSLAAVRADIIDGLRRQYRNVTLDAALAQPRQFYVHVSGAVPEPGRHLVRPVARVEDGIAQATGTSPRDLALYARATPREGDRWPALRNVSVEREGEVLAADLMRYFATGDLEANPYLRDGDAVYLPTFDPVREGVFVGGAVDRPGTYDVRSGDTAYDLVVVASGRDPEARVERVRVARRDGTVEEVGVTESRRVSVGPRDQIFAVSEAPDAGVAVVVGAVRYPGTYPIVAGETTLAALVEAAGGLQPDALARGAYLERSAEAVREARPAPEAPDGPRLQTQRDEAARLDSTVAALGGLSVLDLSGRRYYAREYLRTARVSVDVASALSGGTAVTLRDGDRLVVPEDRGSVRVFGEVARPGFVAYQAGLDAAAYLREVGGAGPRATDRYIVEAGTGRFLPAEGAPVQPGDAVFVDRETSADDPQIAGVSNQERQLELQRLQAERDEARLDLENSRDRRAARFQLIQTTITAVATLATVALAIASLNRTNE